MVVPSLSRASHSRMGPRGLAALLMALQSSVAATTVASAPEVSQDEVRAAYARAEKFLPFHAPTVVLNSEVLVLDKGDARRSRARDTGIP